MQLLTHSRQDCFKLCRKKHWYSYEQNIRRELDSKALRMGNAYHLGHELIGKGHGLDGAVEAIQKAYETVPEFVDQYEWEIERETVVRLLCGYEWRWQEMPVKTVATEMVFQLPLVNPESGSRSRIFDLGGKLDGIAELPDGRLAVWEYKLLGDDISADAPLWRRLQFDHQISRYMLAARAMDYPVETVMYDVTRKPTIKPTDVPILDMHGTKIVLDWANNRVKTEKGFYRQTPDKEKGYVLQVRQMSPEEWGEKLNNDIAERPDYYYRRQEVPRLDQDLQELEQETWDIQLTLRQAQRSGQWFKTVSRFTCDGCPYFGLCARKWQEGDPLPDGFVHVENIHPELEGLSNGSHQATAAAS